MTTKPLSSELLSRVEDAGLNASAPPQQRWIDGWLARFSPGKAKRARCVNALSEGVLAIGERLSLCQALYREAGLRMLVRITSFSRPAGLDDWLARQGFQRLGESAVMVRSSLDSLMPEPLPNGLRFEEVDSEAYAHIVGDFRAATVLERHAHAERLMHSPVPYRGVLLRSGNGVIVACAQGAIEADMVGLYDVFTAASERGNGLSRWLCGRLLSDARTHGARLAYLQVDAQNHPARALYRRLGFVDAYSYHYRALPEVSETALQP